MTPAHQNNYDIGNSSCLLLHSMRAARKRATTCRQVGKMYKIGSIAEISATQKASPSNN